MECYAIVSHHARMRCFLNKWLKGPNDETNILKMKFNNASVLEIFFGENGDVTINVVWGGGDQLKKPNAVTHFVNRKNMVQPLDTFPPVPQKAFKKSMVQQTLQTEQYEGLKLGRVKPNLYTYEGTNYDLLRGKTFFIFRHAQGIHNVNKTDKWLNSSRYVDAPLTENGINQAYTAGVKLRNWLGVRQFKGLEDKIAMFFVSDLQRTHQTCREILQVLYPESPEKRMMYVLPCLHELNSGCDKDMKNMVKMSENQIRCNPRVNDECESSKDVVWDFNKYEVIHPDGKHDYFEYRDKEFCTTLNVFEQAVLTAKESLKEFEHAFKSTLERDISPQLKKYYSDKFVEAVDKFPYATELKKQNQIEMQKQREKQIELFNQPNDVGWLKGGRSRRKKRKRTRRKRTRRN
jgi:broad specificity phosphatase PhoE